MIINFRAPRYQAVPQNFTVFGFAGEGTLVAEGFLRQFYWNDRLLDQSNMMLRFGAIFGSTAATTTGAIYTVSGGDVYERYPASGVSLVPNAGLGTQKRTV